jgi:gluconate 5-dehydrogenase
MTFPLFDLAGLRALVTGSSQGIGLALARGLAQHGAEVVLNGRDRAKLDDAVRELADTGARVSASDFDVTDADAVKRGVDAIEGSTGPIDILINNAGMQFRSPLEEFPVERWEQLLKTNVSSAFYVGQASPTT